MKRISVLFVMVLIVALAGCRERQSSDDVQRQQQERILAEGTSQVGMPAVKNFREKKILKDIIELRDQTGLATYTYLWSDVQGKLVFFCNSVGYGIPYATQFTNPQKIEEYSSAGYAILPQADPNGLFSPSSAEGTWVMCKDSNSSNVRPTYVEPRVIVSQFRLY